MNKVKAMTKKPGPPVPPRPPASSISARSRSESRATPPPPVALRASRTSPTTTAPTAGSPMEAGRTVIYKSPSFDLKKRQSSDRSYVLQDEDGDRKISIKASDRQQEQQQIFIINECNNNNSSGSKNSNVVTIDNRSNRTEIVITNNNDGKSEENGRDGNSNCSESTRDNSNADVLRGIPITRMSSNVLTTDFPVVKISPTPKPRTLTLPKQSRSLDAGEVTKMPKDTVTVNNTKNNANAAFVKNIEVENNLKNAAERLFTEIIVNQTQSTNSKTEQYISVGSRYLPPKALSRSIDSSHFFDQKPPSPIRTCVNLKQRPEPEGGETNSNSSLSNERLPTDPIKPNYSPEKKVAFHEILISELAAMRKRNSEQDSDNHESTDAGERRCDKVGKEKGDWDGKSQRKRYPSGCSTDSSPYGTQRSARIRTSDWVEVGDNGKEVTLTSCHISLEDSGMEDEERLDDTSSGVGDSWDSVKDAEER